MPYELTALRCAPPAVGIADAERIALDIYGVEGQATRLSGERDCNFRVHGRDDRRWLLKILDDAADPQITDCQIRVLRHVAEQDPALPVPRLFPTVRGEAVGRVDCGGTSHSSLLMEFLPGRVLGDRASQPLLVDMGATLARLDRALRGFFHPALAQGIAWDVRRLPQLMEFVAFVPAQAARTALESVLRDFVDRSTQIGSVRAQAIHGDGHSGNLLVDPAGNRVCGILDFGDMIHAPLVLEPAVAMSELLTEDACALQDLGRVIEGYAGVAELQPGEVELLFDLIRARHAVTILLHGWRTRHDPAGARLVERAATAAVHSLERLQDVGRQALTASWRAAAGMDAADEAPVDLGRRRRLLGTGAELFYERPLHLVRGEGVWLYDPSGRRYLDVYNNVPHVGHCHPAVVRAVKRQTARLVTHTRYLHGRILDYAEALTARLPAHLDACIFVNSGSEANDVAWRMAQFAAGCPGAVPGGGAVAGAVVMANAYHGITDAVAALTPGAGEPQDPRVVTLAPPTADLTPDAVSADLDGALDRLAARGLRPAAFFLDSALTSSGIFDPPPWWYTLVASRLRAAGALLVGDEVQYGLGRSGSHFWGFERRRAGEGGAQTWPDVVTLGKPVGNGFPMGVVIARRELIEAFQARFGFFSTFGGNPVAAAAGLAVLDVLDRERLMENALATGRYLRTRLEDLSARHRCLGAARGTGLLLGLEVRGRDAGEARSRTKEIVNVLSARHAVLIGSEGPEGNILKLRPPMPFDTTHADLLLDALTAAASAIDDRNPPAPR